MHVLAKTPGTGDIITVIYRKGERILGLIVGVAGISFLLYAIVFLALEDVAIGKILTSVAVVTPALWFIFLVARAKLVVREGGLYIQNWFTHHWIPWNSVAELEVDPDLALVLRSGDVIQPSVGGGSLAGAMRGNRAQRAMRESIEHARKQAQLDEHTTAQRNVDLGLRWLLALYAFFAGVSLIMSAVV